MPLVERSWFREPNLWIPNKRPTGTIRLVPEVLAYDPLIWTNFAHSGYNYGRGSLKHATYTNSYSVSRGDGLYHTDTTAKTTLMDTASELQTTGCTIFLQMKKTDATNRSMAAFHQGTTVAASTLHSHVPYSNGTVYFYWYKVADASYYLTYSGGASGENIWAFSAGSRGMEMWKNGILVASNSTYTAMTNASATGLHLGNGLSGTTSDLCIYRHYSHYRKQMPTALISAISKDLQAVVEPE